MVVVDGAWGQVGTSFTKMGARMGESETGGGLEVSVGGDWRESEGLVGEVGAGEWKMCGDRLRRTWEEQRRGELPQMTLQAQRKGKEMQTLNMCTRTHTMAFSGASSSVESPHVDVC